MTATIIWACLGIALIIIEIFTATFFLVFCGASALVVALIKLVTGLDQLAWELVLFAVIAVAATALFRKKIKQTVVSGTAYRPDENKAVTVVADILPGATGGVMYRGTSWKALNNTGQVLTKGSSALIEKVDGIVLILK